MGWVAAKVGDIITLNPKNDCADNAVAGFVPMPLLGKDYRSLIGHECRTWAEIKKGYTHFADGDVLLAKITPCFENGKAGLVCGMPNGVGAGSTEYFVSRPNPDALDARYLLAMFKTEAFLNAGALEMTGSVGHKRVPKEYLTESEIPLAPLNEQKRIADKLDAVLARVDACRDRLDHIPDILKRFRQSVLAAATSGALTEDWRTENAAIDNWKQGSVQTVAHVGTGSTPLRSNPAYFSAVGTPWITSAATSKRLVTTADEFVTSEAISAHRLKTYPVGTLLVAMYGEGKTRGQVTELGIPATINQACAAMIVDESKASRAYVKLALQANYFEMRELAEGGNQPNLNLSKVKEFPLSLPDLAEQTEIVRRVETLFAFANRLETRYATAYAQVEKLTPSLLAKAFRGELVPQDPNDEPASLLLSRLRQPAQKLEPIRPSRGRRK
jgi:type I restriction enzyme S subunit